MNPNTDGLTNFVRAVHACWNGAVVWVIVLIILMIVDFIFGFANAWLTKSVNSSASYRGMVKKIAMLLMVIVMVVLDPFTPGLDTAKATASAFLGTELISIIESLGALGIPIPPVIMDVLSKLHPEKSPLPISVKIDTSTESGGPVDVRQAEPVTINTKDAPVDVHPIP